MHKLILVILLLYFCLGNATAERVKLLTIDKKADHLMFDALFTNGLRIDGIHYLKGRVAKRWLLQIRSPSGTKLSTSNYDEEIKPISSADFVELLDVILSKVSNRKDIGLDVIQIDLRFIPDVWNESVLAVKHAAKSNIGLVDHKDKSTGLALLTAIQQSELLAKTCAMVENHSYKCVSFPVGINPISFQRAYFGKNWEEIVRADDAGISESTWFGISITD